MDKKYVGIFIRLTQEQYSRIKLISELDEVTIAELIRMAVGRFLRGKK